MTQRFKVTYATVSADNEELQSAFDDAISQVEADWMGVEVPMFINGEETYADRKLEKHSPINTKLRLCTAQRGTKEHARAAITAARTAFADWRRTPWQERVATLRAQARLAQGVVQTVH